ncbi:MAG: Gfo/Idh/MocA family oxidoreductase [Fuerstia sp.]|nr:Gfo/Idh/MocA family oxidoreductase [Fuerstiella sp.]
MTIIRTAILGTGFMSWVHADALRRNGVEVYGVLGSSVAKSRAAAEQLGIPKAFSSLDELLSDPQIDCIHVCTPNRSHFEIVSRAIAAGKHVLCEKPLAMTSQESAALRDLAAQHPELCTGVNYNIRFYPLCAEVRSRLQTGSLGNVFHVNGSYVQDWLIRQTDYNWRVLADEGGALRAVADIGTHWLDLIRWMTGLEVEEVLADLVTFFPTRIRPAGEVVTFSGKDAKGEAHTGSEVSITTDDYGAILLKFAGGARGTLHVSQVTAGRKNCLRFEIAASHGAVAWDSEIPNSLWLGHRDAANEQLTRDPALLSPDARVHAAYPGGHNEGYADSFRACFAVFYADVRRSPESRLIGYPTFSDGHREIQLCEAILRSHQQRVWVRVGEMEAEPNATG